MLSRWAPSRRETIYGASDQGGGRAGDGSPQGTADRLAVEAWNKRMLGFQGPAQRRGHRPARCGSTKSSMTATG